MPSILFADADRELLELYGWLLTSYGFRVDKAGDALECLDKLRRSVPDLLILELELPWGGGDGVLAILREDPRLLPARVVLTSAVASVSDLAGFESPGVRTLSKPIRLSALLERGGLAGCIGPGSLGTGGILIVDVESSVRNYLKSRLQYRGFRVWTASGGEEALGLCFDHGEEIGVVLIDVRIVRRDGPATLEGIRALDPHLPVCFMGEKGDYESSESPAPDVRHLFRKPFRLQEILRVVPRLASEQWRGRHEIDTRVGASGM